MFKGQWMLLKGRMEIGHTGVTGVTGLGNQAQIGEGQYLGYFLPHSNPRPINSLAEMCIKKYKT